MERSNSKKNDHPSKASADARSQTKAAPFSPTLQAQLGNLECQTLAQSKHKLNQPQDSNEQEANRNANALIGSKLFEPITQGQSSTPHHRSEAMPVGTRQPFEQFFKTDLSQVRIHDNAAANRDAWQKNAQAFTRGNNIYFESGKFNPSSKEGKQLLAHELTHTLQPNRDPNLVQRDPVAPEQSDDELDAELLQRFEALPGFNAIDMAPELGGLQNWSSQYPRSYEEMRTRAVNVYQDSGFEALVWNDAEILILVQQSALVMSRLYELQALYELDQEAAQAVIDYYVGVNYLWGGEDVRGFYDVSYSFFGQQFAQDSDFNLGLYQMLLQRDVDSLVSDVESEANAAQADADADVQQRQEWAEAARAMLGTVVAKRQDILIDDELSLATLLEPQEGSSDAQEMVAIASLAGRMAAVVRVNSRYHAFTLSENFDRRDITASSSWNRRTEIVRYGSGARSVYTIVAAGGLAIRTNRGGERFYAGDQGRNPERYLEAYSNLLESGRADELGISPVTLFANMVRGVALANLRQAEIAMTDIQESMVTDHYIDLPGGRQGMLRGPDPQRGQALQRDTARLRQLTIAAERLAHEIGDQSLSDAQTDQRDLILNEMAAILQRNPAAGFFVQNSRDPDEDDPVEDDEVSNELEGLQAGDAAAQAHREANTRKENIATVRRALFDDPDLALGLEPLHALVLAQFSQFDQLRIRASLMLHSLQQVASVVGLLAVDISLLVAGFFTGGSAWAGLTLHAAGTGLSAYQLNEQMRQLELVQAMSELDVPGGVQLATPEQAASARNWAIFGIALNFLGIAGLGRSVGRLMGAAQREGNLVSRIARRAGVADDVMAAALRRNVLGMPRPDPSALRQIVLAQLPDALRQRYANLVIDVMDEQRWIAQFGRDSAEHAATRFATNSSGQLYPSVVMFRARGSVLALQEEAMHIAQSLDPAFAGRIGRVSGLTADAWTSMSRSQKLTEIRTVLELEHDAQSRLLQRARLSGEVEAADNAAEQMSDISRRMQGVDEAIANPNSALPTGLDLSRSPQFLHASPRIPRVNGTWSGLEGNSIWRSQHPDVIAITGNGHVRFRNGYPDFSSWSTGRVNIGQTGRAGDFGEADRLFAQGVMRGSRSAPSGFSRADFIWNGEANAAATARYRRAAGLTWHHHQGGRQMLLVPTRLHANVPHTGGASAARAAGP